MKLYNTLSQKIEEFVPVTPGEVKMYACGPTVYNYFHIGNSRVFVLFDTLRSYLKYRGFKVTFVQNITDIDDKIINKANLENVPWNEISQKYTDAYLEDIKRLNIDRPDVSPRATREIPEMIALIKNLVDKGIAYVSKNGVYFSVEKFRGYGELSHQDMDQLQEGARVEVDDEKKSGLDFALWKFTKPGEPSWESPWGAGRPGWHIECSAMSSKYLSGTFDIHGGGADLIFPHHENERAQSEAASGQKFVNYWMHVGYMNIDGIKMSKSKGNFDIFMPSIFMYPTCIQ
jgi:cysteinyl-tRNA synthetase